jgi:hypothetical protein
VTTRTARARLGLLATLASSAALASCAQQQSVPSGYLEECWGGKDEYYDSSVANNPALLITIAVREPQWSALRERFVAFAAKENLTVFDTSVSRTGVRTVELFACSSRGVQVHATQRVWDPPKPTGLPEDRLNVKLYCFQQTSECAALATRLESEFRKEWPEVLYVEYR